MKRKRIGVAIAAICIFCLAGCSLFLAPTPLTKIKGTGQELALCSAGLRAAAHYWCEWFDDGEKCDYLAKIEEVLDSADAKIGAFNEGIADYETEIGILLNWAERALDGIAGHAEKV